MKISVLVVFISQKDLLLYVSAIKGITILKVYDTIEWEREKGRREEEEREK